MLRVTNNDIQLTRGDSADLLLTISNTITGDGYTPVSGDVVRLTIRRSTHSDDAVIEMAQTLSEGDEITFSFAPEDTQTLDYGTYVYDIELTTTNGSVYTIITPSKFRLTEEVTFHGR